MKNFGKIKNTFNNLLVESISSRDSKNKELFKKYINNINKNSILKEQFLVYTNIESKSEPDRDKAREYIKANILSLKKHNKKDISEANLALAKTLLFEKKVFNGDDILNDLYENISKLIFLDVNLKNIDPILEATDKVVDYISNNKKSVVSESNFLPNSILSSIHVDKFNEKYVDLTEDEKLIFKTIIESDEEGKELLFNKLNEECVDLVDKHLVESSINTKEKLLTTKDKILRSKYVKESFIDDISKLITLKSDLLE